MSIEVNEATGHAWRRYGKPSLAVHSGATERFLLAALIFTIFAPLLVAKYLATTGLGLGSIMIVLLLFLGSTPPWIAFSLGAWLLFAAEGLSLDTTALRWTALFPAALLCGRAISLSPSVTICIKYYSTAAYISSIVAIVELRLRRSLFGFDELSQFVSRDGRGFRAFAAAEHPLVLSTLLVVSIVFIIRRPTRPLLAVAEISLLLGGILATGSRGPFIVAISLITIIFFLRVRHGRSLRISRPIFVIVTAVIAVFLLYISLESNTQRVTGVNAKALSVDYRYYLYGILPRALSTHLFGIGFGSIPQGVYLASGNGRTIDLATSIDSEPVLLVLRFGIVGLVAFLIFTAYALYKLPLDREGVALAVLAILACSLTLSVSSWNTLGTAFFLLLGITTGKGRTSRPRISVA